MEVLYPRCAGLDVHNDMVMARVRCVSEPWVDETRSFATTTGALMELEEWLSAQGVTHVAMEATGVYWKPVWHLLEGHFELILANAQHIKNVPGRKTDVNDAAWIADLLAHGLIRASFVPPAPIQELRDLTRTRKQLVREISQHSLRIQKTLEDANLKLGSVLSNILGRSGPGVSELTAHVVVAEIGVDMARFPTAGHLLSWATMCPRNDESAGKRRSTRTRKGAPWLKTALVTAAWAAVRVKGSYLQGQFLRLKARRGAKKAILAVAASILTAAWHMLKNGVEYKDLGADHFARRDRSKAILRLVRRLNDLGCEVQIAQAA